MNAITELEKLGYSFQLRFEREGKRIEYSHNGRKIDAAAIRPLLATVKQRREEAIAFLILRNQTGTRQEHLNYVIKVRINELERMIEDLEPADALWQQAAKEYDRLHKQFVNPRCPICWHEIDLVAAFDSDTPGQPENPFWGQQDNKVAKCQKGAWFHFIIIGQHRLAYMVRNRSPPNEYQSSEKKNVTRALPWEMKTQK